MNPIFLYISWLRLFIRGPEWKNERVLPNTIFEWSFMRIITIKTSKFFLKKGMMVTVSLVCRERPGPGEFYKFHTRPPAWSALSPACPSGSPRSWPARCPGCARAGSSGRPAPLPHWLSPAVQISGLAGERRPGLGCSLDVEEYSEELLCQQ